MKTLFDDTFTYMLRPRTKGTWCHLRVLKSTAPSSARAIVIATQLKSAASIMNVAELLAAYAVSFFDLDPNATTYIEHWTTESSEFRGSHYSYELVHFDWEENDYGLNPQYVALHAEWEYVSDSVVSQLIRNL